MVSIDVPDVVNCGWPRFFFFFFFFFLLSPFPLTPSSDPNRLSLPSGTAFCALIHKHHPDLMPWQSVGLLSPVERAELAVTVAESIGKAIVAV